MVDEMKKVLITGANSFLGENTRRYLLQYGGYQVDVIDMLDDNWRLRSFSSYDVVFNVCAIVHRFDNPDERLYFKVNTDLAIEIARKAYEEGVKQFIQTSTVGVFGIDLGEMNESMGFHPNTPYEKSKYAADIELEKMRSHSFKVCILRPPMMYGNGCRGNFPKLEQFAKKYPVFPSRKTRRDMIYIENMCDFIRFAIEKELDEICYPRDKEPVCVCEMVKQIAELNGKRIHLLGVFNPIVGLLYKTSHKLRSVFGDNYCTMPISAHSLWTAPFAMNQGLKRMYSREEFDKD